MLIGYARVSKADGSQSLDLQRDALRAEGVDAVSVYHDCASGVRDDRPGLDSCVRALRTGDVLVVWKLDRLGRTLAHLVNTVQNLSARGVGLRVLTGQGAQIDTTTAAGRLVFGIFAALAEFERELIRERTLAGLTAARTPRRQDVRAVESPGAAGPGRDGAPRHLRVRALPRTRDRPRDALPVRRAAGPVARARREGPRPVNRSALVSWPEELAWLMVVHEICPRCPGYWPRILISPDLGFARSAHSVHSLAEASVPSAWQAVRRA